MWPVTGAAGEQRFYECTIERERERVVTCRVVRARARVHIQLQNVWWLCTMPIYHASVPFYRPSLRCLELAAFVTPSIQVFLGLPRFLRQPYVPCSLDMVIPYHPLISVIREPSIPICVLNLHSALTYYEYSSNIYIFTSTSFLLLLLLTGIFPLPIKYKILGIKVA